MRIDLFVKLKYRLNIAIIYILNNCFVCDLIVDVNNYGGAANSRHASRVR